MDANQRDAFFGQPPKPEYVPAVAWITQRRGRLVYGGRLRVELAKKQGAARILAEWVKSGLAVEYSDEVVQAEEQTVIAIGIRSDDEHVLALARLSGARLIATEDEDLIADTTDKRLLDKPRGRIYQRAEHEHLLNHSRSCGLPPTRTARGRLPST
ncbi:MAG: hypothetical protein ACKVT1_13870 [Dehalococcoidia bacterium]